jgi:hypothetical protein
LEASRVEFKVAGFDRTSAIFGGNHVTDSHALNTDRCAGQQLFFRFFGKINRQTLIFFGFNEI